MTLPEDPDHGRFFLPGPTEVRGEVLQAQLQGMMPHRGSVFVALMEELQAGLRDVFRTERPVVVSTSSATGLMEAGIRNSGTGPVLSLVNGAFSQRFADIARACGRDVDVLDVPWGQVHDPQAVRDALGKRAYEAVTVVHSETSTGALQPLEEVARVVAEGNGPLLLVDSVTGLGGARLLTDAWGLDLVLTGSQKALALPPGLAFGVASERLLARAEATPARGVYFDLVAHYENLTKNQTPNTPALTLLYATRTQLARIAAEGMEARWARHDAMARRTWAWVRGAGGAAGVPLHVLAPEGARSPTVTAVAMGDSPGTGATAMDPRAVVAAMASRGWVLGGGYGKLKDATFRIGHMGDHTVDELDVLLGDLTDVLRSLA